ncbi:MAG: oxygen-dependent coproporphyrinogen oxidase [Pseudomonadales bacterium]|nr:oxygen-dependent coproporphyrinogen oxidase [Pseudomonadales bacterium]
MNASELVTAVRAYFLDLQETICRALESEDGTGNFSKEPVVAPNGGLAQPRVLADGRHIEKAAVQFTHSIGDALPPAATERNPHLAGSPFQAVAISLIVHPQNPFAPTTHMNLRFFVVDAEEPAWYFGGGYDLTPYYAYEDDVVHWHQTAAAACGAHYPALKAKCDEYFFLRHRQECRGVGGVFFDDWTEGGFDSSLEFVKSVGDSFLPAYLPILSKRKSEPYSEAQRDFQLYRRGRYAEFNLAIDRGTKYGLQSGRRVESVLASLPPLVKWVYNYQAEPGSREAELTEYFLKPRDWLAE